MLAIAYFVGWLPSGKPEMPASQAAKQAPAKPKTATMQSGVVLLPGETLVAPPDPVPPAPATPPAPAAKPAPAPAEPKYTRPKPPPVIAREPSVVPREPPPVIARETPRPPPRTSYERSTRSVCVNCGVVTSITRGDYDWEVRVRFDDGSREILRYYDRPRVSVGDEVHLENGRLVRD